MKPAFKPGTKTEEVVKGMALEWLNPSICPLDPRSAWLPGGAFYGKGPIYWAAVQFEPDKYPDETVDNFIFLVKEKKNPEDLAVFTDRENNVVVLAHLKLQDK
jgi:hypothetical protein